MKTHTNSFKEQIKLIGKEIDSRITFGDTVLGKNDLNAVTPSYQGAILKSVMKQLDIDSNVEIPIGTILTYEFGLKVNGEYEYINYGNYIVYSIEKQEDTNSYKITCYDKMLFAMRDYVKMPITYPITIRDYINSLCTFLGLTFANKNDTFANYDKKIQNELYLDVDGNSLGYTFRDVFDELAQVTASEICLNNNNEVEIRYINDAFNTNKASGLGNVSFDDAIEEDIKLLVIDGKSVQETRSGKNKLEFIIANQTVNGLEIINNNDGSLTLNGTTTNSVSMQFSKTMNNLVAGDYYLSMNPTGTVSTNFTKIIYGRQNTTTAIELANTSTTDEKSFTTNTDYNYYYLWLYIKSGITFTNYVIRPQLENGTTFTGWECYGATPTPNIPSEIESLGTYNETTSKYGIEVKVTNGTDTKTTVLALNEPLRSVGETKDIAYIKNNKLYVDRYVGSVILNGSEGWNMNSGVGFHTSALQGNVKNIGKALSNRYVYDKWTWQGNYTFSINSTGILAISDNTYSSVEDFKTWLSTNNVQVDYELATPITEELGEISIKTLDGTNNINLVAKIETNFEMEYITGIDTIDEEFLKDINVNFGEKFGAINTIVLTRSGGSDSIYYPETLPDNPVEIKIEDNQIMNFNNRDEFLPDIYEKLNGLEYYLNDFSSTGITYYDLCDRYNVKVGDNIYSCVMFNDEILVTQGLEENIFTEMPKETKTDYTKADKTDRKINQVSLIVDKQKQEIKSIAEKVVDISNVIKGVGNITLENAYEGNLHKLTIKGNISLIYPSNDLYPSDNLYPKTFKLQVDENVYNLDINYLNYINEDVCDEFVYEDGNCYIIRRVGIDKNGGMYELPNDIFEERKDVLINVLENSKITLLGFGNAILTVEYLLQNQYTDVFATQVYVNSEIKQTADTINLEVSKKMDENQVNSMIKQTADEINIEVRKKVDGTEVVSTINQSAEEINLKSNRLIVDSDNFQLTKEGNLTCNNGVMKNINIDGGKITMTGAQNSKRLIIKTNEEDFIASIAPYQMVMTRNDTLNNLQSILGAGSLTVYDNNYNYDGFYGSSGFYCTSNNEFTIYGDGSNGNISCVSLTQTSLEKNKKNFEKLDNALDIIKNTDIYKYHLKNQNDNEKKHVGFVIGDDYNYSKEVTSTNNDGAEIYSMVSVCFKAIQEQQEQIKMLKNEINQLKEMIK